MTMRTLIPALAVTMLAGYANAQTISIHTGKTSGAYYNVFGPPVASFLKSKEFTAGVADSNGSVDNINRIMENPYDLAFTQPDVYALMKLENPKIGEDTQVLDFNFSESESDPNGKECLFAVVTAEKAKTYTSWFAVNELANRTFIGVIKDSGSHKTLEFIKKTNPALRLLKIVTFSSNDEMFSELEKGTIKLAFMVAAPNLQTPIFKTIINEKHFGLIAAYDDKIAAAQIGDKPIYKLMSIPFGANQQVQTACMPISLITGSKNKMAIKYPDRGTDEQKENNELMRTLHSDMVSYMNNKDVNAKIIKAMKAVMPQKAATEAPKPVSAVSDVKGWLEKMKALAKESSKLF